MASRGRSTRLGSAISTIQLLEGHANPAKHGLEEVCLVPEMPVDGTARHAGVTSDLLKRRTGDPLGEEDLFGGVQQGLPSRGGFGLGASGHG